MCWRVVSNTVYVYMDVYYVYFILQVSFQTVLNNLTISDACLQAVYKEVWEEDYFYIHVPYWYNIIRLPITPNFPSFAKTQQIKLWLGDKSACQIWQTLVHLSRKPGDWHLLCQQTTTLFKGWGRKRELSKLSNETPQKIEENGVWLESAFV